MSQILNKVQKVDPNNSDAVKDVLSTFFQNIAKHTEVDCYQWLQALENIINRFPKYCMTHRGTIETYLVHFLDSTNNYNVIAAAKCAHALQQVRPIQEKTATAKSSWRDQVDTLCTAIHKLLSTLFPQAVDIHKYFENEQDVEKTSDSPLNKALSHITVAKSKSSTNKQPYLTRRLGNVFVFLQAMLVEPYPVPKPVRPKAILDVTVRALSVSSAGRPTATAKAHALRTVDALVDCLGSNLIPFSPLIFKLVMQTLKWTSDNPGDESSEIRITAYASLGRWLSCLRAHAAGDRSRLEDELTAHIVADITPDEHVVQLVPSTQPTNNLSKKAKRKLANSMLMNSNMAVHAPGEKNKIHEIKEENDDVTIAALECAETFLIVCGLFLKPATHKRFHERLVRTCTTLPSGPLALRYLRALDASRRSSAPRAPPPTQYCLEIYSRHVDSDDLEISRFCSQALLDIRLHLHCGPPTISFALEAPQEDINKEKKKVSERNRAALEALLGADKVPQCDVVVTITDEPPAKRHRSDQDLPDRISLSSESQASIEISDDSADETNELQINDDVEVVEDDTQNDSTANEGVKDQLDSNDAEIKEIDEQDGKISSRVVDSENAKITSDTAEDDTKSKDQKTTEEGHCVNIYEAPTQMPAYSCVVTVVNDTEAEESTNLMEVGYDYPNTGKERTPLERIEDENLPSTNDTDDVQITCGQTLENSQESAIDSQKKSEEVNTKSSEEVPKVNGVDKPVNVVAENGFNNDKEEITIATKATDGVTVEDMLADFVDEVNEVNTPA